MNAVLSYFRESWRELELVRWPTRQQAIRLSVIVLVFTAASAVVYGLIDYFLSSSLYFFLTSII